MRSVHIVHQVPRRIWHNALVLIVVVLTTLFMNACTGGTANDAKQGQKQDAERTSIVDGRQATYTWNLIEGTPNATPESSPMP